jgi:hypothetical protein
MALCAGILLTGNATFAADDGSRNVAGTQADQDTLPDIDALLRRVEQQIATGHAMSPFDDSAMETWKHVLEAKRTSPDSPIVLTALASFATKLRQRAADERTAGRLVVSNDMVVFADQATRLLGHNNESTPPPSDGPTARQRLTPLTTGGRDIQTSLGTVPSPPGTRSRDFPSLDPLASPLRFPSTSMPPDPGSIGVTTAQTTAATAEHKVVAGSPAAGGTNPVAARPIPASVHPAQAATVPAPSAVLAPYASGPPVVAAAPAEPAPAVKETPPEFYARRGDEMMAIKDITAARKFYEFAANAGNARAATALARTFDSEFVIQFGVLGLKPDPVLAVTWYRKAAELKDPEAEARLHSLLSNEAAVK